MQCQRAPDLARAKDLVDLRVGDVPEPEPPPRSSQEVGGTCGHARHGALVHRPLQAPRDEELLLRRDQLGRVDLEQRLAAAHRLAGEVDVQLLDEAGELRRDLRDARLVEGDHADGPHLVLQRAHVDGTERDAELADLIGREPDRAVAAHVHPFHPRHAFHSGRAACRLSVGSVAIIGNQGDEPDGHGDEQHREASQEEAPPTRTHSRHSIVPCGVGTRVLAHCTISSPTTRSSSASVPAKSERTRK